MIRPLISADSSLEIFNTYELKIQKHGKEATLNA
jgi:hypothetical protein